jgi:hypothetical protein
MSVFNESTIQYSDKQEEEIIWCLFEAAQETAGHLHVWGSERKDGKTANFADSQNDNFSFF